MKLIKMPFAYKWFIFVWFKDYFKVKISQLHISNRHLICKNGVVNQITRYIYISGLTLFVHFSGTQGSNNKILKRNFFKSSASGRRCYANSAASLPVYLNGMFLFHFLKSAGF